MTKSGAKQHVQQGSLTVPRLLEYIPPGHCGMKAGSRRTPGKACATPTAALSVVSKNGVVNFMLSYCRVSNHMDNHNLTDTYTEWQEGNGSSKASCELSDLEYATI
jgi:hypothetical protein